MIRIADLVIEWQEDRKNFAKDFIVDSGETPVTKLSFCDKLSECHSVQYADCPSEHFLRGKSGDILLANEDWSEANSYCLPKSDADYALPLAAICSRFSLFNAMLIHSSFIECQGKGIIFTGNSGVGKTTQAELWQKFKGARIINGDKAFVREVGGKFFAYGLPWKGSSSYCLNKKAELAGVVVLRQAEENRIVRLENPAELFMPHIFFPHWDKLCLANTLDTFDRLVKNVPVWLLECKPDEDSVKKTYDAVFG